jgi:hypothetical protein
VTLLPTRPKSPYPTKPTRNILWSAETFERHGYFGPAGITREFDHIYRYVIDSDGWLFHRLVSDEFGRTLGRAFRWTRSAHGDPQELAASRIQKWTERRVKFTVTQDLPTPVLV